MFLTTKYAIQTLNEEVHLLCTALMLFKYPDRQLYFLNLSEV